MRFITVCSVLFCYCFPSSSLAEQISKSTSRLVSDTISGVASSVSSVFSPALSAMSAIKSITSAPADKPVSVVAPTLVLGNTVHGINHSVGIDDSITLGLSQGAQRPLVPAVGATTVDEMDLGTIASMPMLLTTFGITKADIVNTNLIQIPVNPKWLPLRKQGLISDILVNPTFASKVSVPFKYWRGTMRYMFYIPASSFHSFRLRFTFNPLGLSNPKDYENQYTYVADVRGSTVVSLSVPFMFPRAFAMHSTGILNVQVANPIGDTGDTDGAVTVLVYAAMSSDAQFRVPVDDYLVPTDCVNLINAAPMDVQSSARELFSGNFTSVITDAEATSLVQDDDPYFNDVVKHVVDLIRLPQQYISPAAVDLFQGSSAALIDLRPVMQQDTYSAYNIGQKWVPSDGTLIPTNVFQFSSTGGEISFGYLPHFGDCYKFWRGGIRAKVSFNKNLLQYENPLNVTAVTRFMVAPAYQLGDDLVSDTHNLPSVNWVNPIGSGTVIPSSLGMSDKAHFIDTQDRCMIEVEVPYNSDDLFKTTGSPMQTSDDTFGDLNGFIVLSGATYSTPTFGSDLSSAVYCVWRSAADDFRFHFLKGPRSSYRFRRSYAAPVDVERSCRK